MNERDLTLHPVEYNAAHLLELLRLPANFDWLRTS